MQIDSSTVLLIGTFIKALLGTLFLAFWLRERDATWYLWWGGTFLLGCFAAGFFALQGLAANFFSLGLGNAAFIAAFACCWPGARAFDRRRPIWWPAVVLPALWLAACTSPTFMETLEYRIALSSLLLAFCTAATAFEFWRGRVESLPSRWPVIILFSTLSLFFLSRILLMHATPFPFGALPMQPGWLGGFNLVLMFHTLLLTVLVVAMSKERLELDQRTKAQTDPLTGALNRRAFMTRGNRLVLRHQIDGAPLCLLFIDIDHFKSLNDRVGHSGGDDVLMKFVSVVHDNIRPTDFLFRIGGEEFCCLLSDTGIEQALGVAERIRYQFECSTVDVAGTPVRATVSIGIAQSAAFGYEIDTLMRRADTAVYAAKRQGRNRVVVATADEESEAAVIPLRARA